MEYSNLQQYHETLQCQLLEEQQKLEYAIKHELSREEQYVISVRIRELETSLKDVQKEMYFL